MTTIYSVEYEPKEQQNEHNQTGTKQGLSWEQVGTKTGLGWNKVDTPRIYTPGAAPLCPGL